MFSHLFRPEQKGKEADCQFNEQREQLCDSIQSLTGTIRISAENFVRRTRAKPHDEAPPWAEILSKADALDSIVQSLRAPENADVGTGFPIEGPACLQVSSKIRRADHGVKLWTASAVTGNQDLVMADMPDQASEYGGNKRPTFEKRPVEVRNEVTRVGSDWAELVGSSAPLAMEFPFTEDVSPIPIPPRSSGSDSHEPEQLIRPRKSDRTLTPATIGSSACSTKSAQGIATGAIGVLTSPCAKLSRTLLPGVPLKQANPRKSSQAPCVHSDLLMQLDTKRESSFDQPRYKTRKRISNQSDDDDSYRSTEPAEPPRKRKKLEVGSPEHLSPKSLFNELTGLDAMDRFKRHAIAQLRDTRAGSRAWKEEGDWAQQTRELFSLAKERVGETEFDRLVALILRAYGLERINAKARSVFKLDTSAPDPYLTTTFINEFAPCLLENRTPTAFRRWLTLTRKFLKLCDYLPFMPLGGKGTITYRHFERMTNKDIQQLLNLLEGEENAQNLRKIGRTFLSCILKHEPFLSQDLSLEHLSKLSQDALLPLFASRHGDQSCGTWNQGIPEARNHDPLISRCDMRLDDDSVSKQSTLLSSEQVSCIDATAQDDETHTGVRQISESDTSSSELTKLQIGDSHSSAVTQILAKTLPVQPSLQPPIPRMVLDAWSSDNATDNKYSGRGNYPIWTTEVPASTTSSVRATSHTPPDDLPASQARTNLLPSPHWQQKPPSELMAVANMILETVVRANSNKPARERSNSVQETRRGTEQVHHTAVGELERQSETPLTLPTLGESRVEQLPQITSHNYLSSERKAFAPTLFCGLHDANTACDQSFICHVVRTRTLLRTSSYDLILRMSMQCDHVRIATRLVVSLYTQTSVSLEHNAASLFVDCLKHTQDKPAQLFAILMLYVHYCVVKRLPWTKTSRLLAYQQNRGIALEKYSLVLFPMYECILNIFNGSSKAHDGLDITWLKQVQDPCQVLDLGLCPRLLFQIGRITELALKPAPDSDESNRILLETRHLQQIVYGAEEDASLVAGQIAATYQLSAQLLVYIRLFGNTPNHGAVRPMVSELAELLFKLPTETSPLHRAMDPLFSVVVCCCLTTDEDVAERLLTRSIGLRRGMKSNVSAAMKAAVWMRQWVKQNVSGNVQHGWFESLKKSIPPFYSPISLG